MALKNDVVIAQPEQEETVLLELALYTNYTWQGDMYEKGKAYRFKRSDAMQLLTETDFNRPVWKIYRAPVQKVTPKNIVIDATSIEVRKVAEPIHGLGQKRINVGDDSEIRDILTEGDVQI